METETSLTLTTPGGRTVAVRILPSTIGFDVFLIAEVLGTQAKGDASGPIPLSPPRDGATYYIRVGRAQVGLAANQAAMLEQAIVAARAKIRTGSAWETYQLRNRRGSLVIDLRAALDAAQEERNARWEKGDEEGGVTRNRYDIEAAEAGKALADFDLKHPEIIEEIERERTEQAARAIWY
jgi:hypothetical protein